MPRFSQASFSKLATCHIDLQTLFYEVIKYFDCTILQGFRNEEEQNAAFSSGKSKLPWPNGLHNQNPSLAVDVAFYPIDWNKTNNFIYFGGIVMGIAAKLKDEGKINHEIRWGGAWDGCTKLNDGKMLNDYVHFELIQ